jgi:hypothetical protein
MKLSAKTPEGRLRQFCVLRARQHGHDADWVRARATELFGIPATEGFCLTALSKPQLIELANHVVTLTGGTPGMHRRGAREQGSRGERKDPTGVVTHLATREQRDLMLSLAREVFHSAESPAFRGFLAGMVKRSDVRLLSRDQGRKVIEALTSMSKRGWRPRETAGGQGSGGAEERAS